MSWLHRPLLCVALLSGGCTQLLGIDGDYVAVEEKQNPRNGRPEPTSSGDDSGVPVVEAGVPPITPLIDAETPSDATTPIDILDATFAFVDGGCIGCPDPPNPGACQPGRYVGLFNGSHKPSTTVVGVPLPVSGQLWFDLAPDGNDTLTVVAGRFQGGFIGQSGATDFSADIEGQLDCQTNLFAGRLVRGNMSLVSVSSRGFDGPVSADYDPASAAFDGQWNEAEVAPSLNAEGNGTWRADWAGP